MTDVGPIGLREREAAWWRPGAQRRPIPWRHLLARLGQILRFGTLLSAIEAEQDRWFLWLPVLIGCGIGTYFALPAEPPILLAAGTLAIALGLLLATRDRREVTRIIPARPRQGLYILAMILLSGAIGFAAAQIRAEFVGAPVLTRSTGSTVLTGWIEDVEQRGSGAYRTIVRVVGLEGLDGPLPMRVRVRVQGTAEGLRIGAPIRLRVRLSAPPLPALPGDYDFARRAYFQRIGGVGYARSAPRAAPELGPPPWSIAVWAPGENLRRVVAERIAGVLAGDRAAITTALIQGDQGGISPAAMQTMRDSGLAHILSISGLHMAIVAGALFWAIRALLALSPIVTQLFPVRAIAAVFAGAGALFYLMLSGWQVPAVRSFVMIAIMFLAIVLARPALSLRNVALAALLLLLARPENIFDVSFLMSFSATVGLVALYEEIGERRRARTEAPEPAGPIRRFVQLIGADILTTLVAGLSVAPLGAYFFHAYQHYSVLGNLLALPIVSLWLMPLVLIVLVTMPLGLDALPLYLMGYGIDALMAVGTWVASLPGAVSAIAAMPLSAVLAMMLGALWLALWRRAWRWLGLAAIGAGCWHSLSRIPPDILIGREGDAVAVRLDNGLLSALGGKRGAYEIARWLEHDGDRRSAAVASQGRGFACDAVGCSIRVKDLTLAYIAHPAALGATCAKADIVVVKFPKRRACLEGRIVIDLFDLRQQGTHVIHITQGVPALTTLGGHRGSRPWTRTWGTGAGTGEFRQGAPAPLTRPPPPAVTEARRRWFGRSPMRDRETAPAERDPW